MIGTVHLMMNFLPTSFTFSKCILHKYQFSRHTTVPPSGSLHSCHNAIELSVDDK